METTNANSAAHTHHFSLPFGFFAGPVFWALQLLIGYALTPVACQAGTNLAIYIVSAVTGIIILAAGWLAYRNWREYSHGHRELVDSKAQISSSEFVALSGALLSTLFFLLVLYTGVSMIFLNPCPVITQPFP